AVADRRGRAAGGQLARIADGVGLKVEDDGVNDAQFVGLNGPDVAARGDGFQRDLNAGQARQADGAASAGQQAQLDFGQADLGRADRDAGVRRQGQLQTAAQGRAVYGRDDRLGAGFELRLKRLQAGLGGAVG